MPSVKKNFAWSTILTVAGYIFPLITFPYITRILGVEGIGGVQFADSVIAYLSVFAMLGIGTVGVREIAKAKGNKERLSVIYNSLITLNLITTLFAIIALLFLIKVVPSFESHSRLLYIGIAKILCGSLLIEWFYRGVEDFRYITICSLIVRLLYVVSVLAFVRTTDDYVVYYILTTAVTVLNAIINIIYARHYVTFSLKGVTFRPYIKAFFILGIYMILTNLYNSFNVVYLGTKCGDIEVGYYTTATKLYAVIMSVFTAFTTVMMPRMSSLVSEGKNEEFYTMTSKSIDFLLLFCVPIIVLSEVYAPQIIRIIAGASYEGSILPMRIVMPLMLIIGYEQIIVIQMLMPLRKDNSILINSSIGAATALILNFSLVPLFAAVGSAVVWCCCETAVAISAQFFVTKYTGYRPPIIKIILGIVAYLPALLFCLFIDHYMENWLASMITGFIFVGTYFFVVEYFILKNRLFVSNIDAVFTRIFKNK